MNTNPDLVELLKARIESAGFVVLIMHVAEIRAGLDLAGVTEAHHPSVIVFVLTTPNAAALGKIVGRDEQVYEILDDSADIDTIVQAVREAARARPTT